ncbi:hypothetical protein MF271_04980 [Deinococcus sp. KNUC1210]|uniref:hypothetical protein n=1 Tax=Deinococcus sp. KNUC1210 TaxID=2917691 RepID=UPI001EEFABA3|nr:hypothetical protein [Deinococcus sp. KNUC1210]ULH15989.1 hypothetical protein MF271_04980 [Deinococcus sp. KNUC1210]
MSVQDDGFTPTANGVPNPNWMSDTTHYTAVGYGRIAQAVLNLLQLLADLRVKEGITDLGQGWRRFLLFAR